MDDPEVKQIITLVSIYDDPTDLFDLMEPIGEGSYGYVYKGMNKRTGELVAIKIVPVTGTDFKSSIKEMEILGKCKSPYVVKYHGAYYKKDHLWLVMQYCEAGDFGITSRQRRGHDGHHPAAFRRDRDSFDARGRLEGDRLPAQEQDDPQRHQSRKYTNRHRRKCKNCGLRSRPIGDIDLGSTGHYLRQSR
jgi:hypothetical protein